MEEENIDEAMNLEEMRGKQLTKAGRDALFAKLGVTRFAIDYEEDFLVLYDDEGTFVANAKVVAFMRRNEDAGVTEWWPNPSNRVVNPSLPIDVEALGRILDTRVGEIPWADFWIREKSLFFLARNLEIPEGSAPPLEDPVDLVKLFARAMSAPDGGEDKHQLITEFQDKFGTFLKLHPSQSVGTFASYLADVGIPYGTPLADVIRIQNFRVPSPAHAPPGRANEGEPSED